MVFLRNVQQVLITLIAYGIGLILLLKKFHLMFFCIDLMKAYHAVSHAKLLYKFRLLGIGESALEWCEEFLCNRKQYVRIGSKLSINVIYWCFSTAGVRHII